MQRWESSLQVVQRRADSSELCRRRPLSRDHNVPQILLSNPSGA